ncbi:Glutamyl-tRNA amidotransferase subunit B, mitochondrial [Crassisporium funariophilum]|nr:Glutamyl-tRNA amidotransferase subunit B, mitochondrial [Crassisporium funariophilum]
MFVRRLSARKYISRGFHDIRTYQEDSRWPGWQVVVGIETHAQIKSRRKLFSDSLTSSSTPQEAPNTRVSPFDAAFPGTLPKINPRCVDLALRTALALNCHISSRSTFDRKHYFYSDLPSGYQITQQYSTNGELDLHFPDSSRITVRIKQIQLEQDTAKSTFNPRTLTSHIDLNRAGTGLMEIVSEPDLRSPEEAGAYVRSLQSILRAMGSSDGNMEQGSLRCDVNVSVNRKGDPPGTRCEVKNLNSVRFMMAAITHEIGRQRTFLLENPGMPVPQETRGFDEYTFETYRLRSKEDAPDYRYMPDPNLGVLVLSQARIDEIRSKLPPLPWETRSRLLERYPELESKENSLDVLLKIDNGQEVGYDGECGTGAVDYFDRLCQENGRPPAVVLNWLTHDLVGQLSAQKLTFGENPLSSERFGEVIDLVHTRTITRTSGKFLLKHLVDNPSVLSPLQVAHNLQLIALSPTADPLSHPDGIDSDLTPASPPPTTKLRNAGKSNSIPVSDDLRTFCESAISALPHEVSAVRTGKKNVLNKIVGHVMKESRGRADAKAVRELVEEMIMLGEKVD